MSEHTPEPHPERGAARSEGAAHTTPVPETPANADRRTGSTTPAGEAGADPAPQGLAPAGSESERPEPERAQSTAGAPPAEPPTPYGAPALAGPPTSLTPPAAAQPPAAPGPDWPAAGWPVPGAQGTGWPGTPPPHPPFPLSWRDAVAGLVVALVVAALGAPLALLWSALGPHAMVVKVQDGAILGDFNSEAFVGGDVSFGAIAIGAGVLVGALAWLLLRRWRGPAVLVGVALGAVVSAWITWKLGEKIGFAEYTDLLRNAEVGHRFEQPMKLRAHGLIFLQATVAVIIYVVNAAWSHRADLGTGKGTHPHPTGASQTGTSQTGATHAGTSQAGASLPHGAAPPAPTSPAPPMARMAESPALSSGPSVPGVPPAAPGPPAAGSAWSPPA